MYHVYEFIWPLLWIVVVLTLGLWQQTVINIIFYFQLDMSEENEKHDEEEYKKLKDRPDKKPDLDDYKSKDNDE